MKYSLTSLNRFGVKTHYDREIDLKYKVERINVKEILKHIMERNPRIKRLTTKIGAPI